ncbi:hypothetical protein [Amycolatopsis speibonae]|uniref:Uncharacterized protein n=1 Tax=Amycolatopsis speibonae TaxID=1450224 RepID=A0ABV7PDF2_9PSEU
MAGAGDADEVFGRAEDAAEQALAELRAVVRGILPPMLADRSLIDAPDTLAARLVVSAGAAHKHIRNIFATLDRTPDDSADRRVTAVFHYLKDVRGG